MLITNISDFIYISFFFITIFWISIVYFKYLSVTNVTASISTDINTKTLSNKKLHFFFFYKFIIIILILLLFQNSIYRGNEGTFWNNHLYLTEFIIFFPNLVLFFGIFVFYILYNLSFTKINMSVDFIFATANIFIFFSLIFLANTFFSFYFLLELTVCIIFYKFTVSKFWFKNPLKIYSIDSSEKFSDNLPKNYLNVLFFQYWISFFSSSLLLLFFIYIEFNFSSTEWSFLNITINYYSNILFYFYFFIFIIGFFLKIGITPFHLYKIEVYRGLPYISIFIYTIIFFFVYFFYFFFLLTSNLLNFYYYYYYIILIILLFGVFYIIFLLFDINFIKSFFAYSTIINLVSFLLLILI